MNRTYNARLEQFCYILSYYFNGPLKFFSDPQEKLYNLLYTWWPDSVGPCFTLVFHLPLSKTLWPIRICSSSFPCYWLTVSYSRIAMAAGVALGVIGSQQVLPFLFLRQQEKAAISLVWWNNWTSRFLCTDAAIGKFRKILKIQRLMSPPYHFWVNIIR